MYELPDVRARRYGVFASSQAHDAGLTRHRVQRLLASGVLATVSRGVYAERALFDTCSSDQRSIARAVAACLTHPGSTVSHSSAGLIHGLPRLGMRPARPTLTVGANARQRGESDSPLRIVASRLPQVHLCRRSSWAVTGPARTVCDLARELPYEEALVAADAALNTRLALPSELRGVSEHFVGTRGYRGLRAVLRTCDGGAESPYETVARARLAAAGQAVVTQVWAFGERGPTGCGDLWLPELWTFVEIDGDVKYSAGPTTALLAEKRRQERFEDAGFGVARVSPAQLRQGHGLLARVRRAAQRGQITRRPAGWVPGYVGPPPYWARRGSPVPKQRPPGEPSQERPAWPVGRPSGR